MATVHIPIEQFYDQDIVNLHDLNLTLAEVVDSPFMLETLEAIVNINQKYGDSWLQDGVFINFADIKDKLTRLEIIVRDGEIEYTNKSMDNYGNVIFDLFVRCLLTMLLDNRVRDYVENNVNSKHKRMENE